MSGATPEFVAEIVRAGAGAGKTWRLTQKTLEIVEGILSQQGRLPRLVITTFTKKATEELRERIIQRVLESGNERLFDLVRSRQHLQISTIHGVLSTFLRSYGHLAGLESEFTIVDESESRRQAKRLLRDYIATEDLHPELLAEFTFEELLSACLSYRKVQLTNPEAEPFSLKDYEISANAIRQRAYAGLKNIIAEILPQVTAPKWVTYLEHLHAMLLDPAGPDFEALGRRPNYKEDLFSSDLEVQFKRAVDQVKKLAEKAYLDPATWPKVHKNTDELVGIASVFAERFNELKRTLGRLDSEDLELFSIEILRKEPALGSAFASEVDYWLIDEYQDTSPLQVEILDQLIGEKPAFFVGDPQQSIYLFRGARTEVFDQREQRILDSAGLRHEMMMNRRSRPEVLAAINDRIMELGEGFSPMTPRQEDFDPNYAALHVFKSSSETPTPYLGLGNFVVEKLRSGARADDFCVLARTYDVLYSVALQFEALGIPCAVHASTGFFRRREVLDLMSLYKFLWNPFDKLNLLRLLRSPWFFMSDQDITSIAQASDGHLWTAVKSKSSHHPAVQRLVEALAKVETCGLSETFLQTLLECKIVDVSQQHDPTGRRESNIWKLLVWLKTAEKNAGFKPSAVFRAFERALQGIDDETDAAASKEPNRVNFMTVHKSKGLSFKHVLIPNMEKTPKYSSERAHEQMLIFDEASQKFSVACKWNNKQLHSPCAYQALLDLENRERDETRRLLYVAMTRAEEGLVFHAVEGSRGFPEDSWAGQVRTWSKDSALKSNKYAVEFHEDVPLATLWQRAENKIKSAPVPSYQSVDMGIRKKRVSVSSILDSEGVTTHVPADSPASMQSFLQAPSFGTLLHAAFEGLRYGAKDMQRLLEPFPTADHPDVISALQYINGLQNPPMRELLQTGSAEWGFQVKTERGILEGQIDLWGTVAGDTWILDYKSGNQKYVSKAFEQLSVYAFALHRAFGIKNFKLAVVFPLEQACKISEFTALDAVAQKYGL
jgi:ATP-dependent helicase/nuclease subunit A